MAGLLTFPSLLYLPGIVVASGVIQANPSKGITAAGTVPDSHRIPLHQAASAAQLPYGLQN
jgi:hypothetical protein